MFKKLCIIGDVINCILVTGFVTNNYFHLMHKWLLQADTVTTIKLIALAIVYFSIILRMIHVYLSYYQLKSLYEDIEENKETLYNSSK